MPEPDAGARCHDAWRSVWFLKLFFTESTGLRRTDVMGLFLEFNRRLSPLSLWMF
jgi:hypothetical protein